MTLDSELKDSKPEKRPKQSTFYGCPNTKYRHPLHSRTSGKFRNLEELRELYNQDLESLSLDLSETSEGITKVKERIIYATLHGDGSSERYSRPLPFDSKIYNSFARIYHGKAKFDGYLINQYEIAIAAKRFMIIFYLSKDEQNFFLLRTNDADYVKSHKFIGWDRIASQLFQQLIESKGKRAS